MRTDAKPSYVRGLAEDVERAIDAVRQGSAKAAATQNLALLAAMRMADQLQQERDAASQLRREVRERSQRILEVLEREANAASKGES